MSGGLEAVVVTDAGNVPGLEEVEVLERLGEPTRFRVRTSARVEDGDIPALADPGFDPGSTVTIVAGGELLVRGPVTGQRAHLSRDDESSYVDVQGGDRSLEMDREEKLVAWSPSRTSDAITAIVASYGFVPDVEPTGTLHSPTSHELVQRGSDLAFVRRMAARHGFLFWVSANPLGIETAHCKPPPVSDGPATTLTMHLNGAALDELDIAWDSDRPTSATAAGVDLGTLSTIDASVAASPLAPMASCNLAALTDGPRAALAIGPGDDLAALSGFGNGLLTEAELFVSASGVTTLDRVGQSLRAHSVVTLDGLGQRHSGNWLVSEVRHVIDAVSHRMEVSFLRNGWEG